MPGAQKNSACSPTVGWGRNFPVNDGLLNPKNRRKRRATIEVQYRSTFRVKCFLNDGAPKTTIVGNCIKVYLFLAKIFSESREAP